MVDPEVFAQARLRMDQLTKPPRALGYLEEVALRLAALGLLAWVLEVTLRRARTGWINNSAGCESECGRSS